MGCEGMRKGSALDPLRNFLKKVSKNFKNFNEKEKERNKPLTPGEVAAAGVPRSEYYELWGFAAKPSERALLQLPSHLLRRSSPAGRAFDRKIIFFPLLAKFLGRFGTRFF